jgi:hypothetical protein
MKLNFVTSILFFLPKCYAYNYKVHSHLGQITEQYLEKNNQELYINLKTIILEPLSNASIWADKVKRTKKFSWTNKHHYIDIDKSECLMSNLNYENLVEKYCDTGCVVNTIYDFATFLKNKTEYVDVRNNTIFRNEIFKFLIHFIQDFNQPMHVFGADRGGNSFKLIRNKNGRNKTTNVHSIWDSEIPEYFIEKYTYIYPNITFSSNYRKLILKVLKDNFELACKIYPVNTFIIFEDYFKQEYLKQLFDNYITLIISTIYYIFN